MQATRDLLLSNWGSAKIIEQKSQWEVDTVTELDYKIEDQVSSSLKAAFPDIEFVGEERGGNRQAERFWLMDPIDGTTHFVRGLPFCTSMLTLVENGKVTFSVIYDFLKDDFYWAGVGRGAFRNTTRLQVSSRPLSEAYINWESNLDKGDNRRIYNQVRSTVMLVQTISAGWEFAMVASGKLDARICLNPYGYDYDFAPGAFLVAEAGGTVANIGSHTYDYRNTNLIAANPVIYKELTTGKDALLPIG